MWSPKAEFLASVAPDGTVRVWDTAVARKPIALDAPGDSARWLWLAFSPEGKRLLVGPQDEVPRIYDVESGDWTCSGQYRLGWLRRVHWSPDGRRLVSGSEDRTIRIWDTQSGRELLVLPDPLNKFPMVAWSPAGQMIGVAGTVAQIFDATIGYELAPQLAHERGVHGKHNADPATGARADGKSGDKMPTPPDGLLAPVMRR